MSIESVILSNHLILCRPLHLCHQSFPASGCFPMSWLLWSGGQSIGATSVSVLPMNIQGRFPLGLTGLIASQSQGTLKSLLQHRNSKASTTSGNQALLTWTWKRCVRRRPTGSRIPKNGQSFRMITQTTLYPQPTQKPEGWTPTQLGVIFSFPLPGFQHQGLLNKLGQPTATHIPESAAVLILR